MQAPEQHSVAPPQAVPVGLHWQTPCTQKSVVTQQSASCWHAWLVSTQQVFHAGQVPLQHSVPAAQVAPAALHDEHLPPLQPSPPQHCASLAHEPPALRQLAHDPWSHAPAQHSEVAPHAVLAALQQVPAPHERPEQQLSPAPHASPYALHTTGVAQRPEVQSRPPQQVAPAPQPPPSATQGTTQVPPVHSSPVQHATSALHALALLAHVPAGAHAAEQALDAQSLTGTAGRPPTAVSAAVQEAAPCCSAHDTNDCRCDTQATLLVQAT